jgi:hypothetical protein
LAIWGAERRGPGAKKSSFSGRTYWVRFAAVNALQRLQSIDRRLILRHLDFFSPKSFSLATGAYRWVANSLGKSKNTIR